MTERLGTGLPGHRAASADPETAPFWVGADQGVLVLPRCRRCESYFWYPRGFCPRCGSDDLDWLATSGRGTVHAATVVRRAAGDWAGAVPFSVAIVTLDCGPSVMANVIDCLVDDLVPGLVVDAVFEMSGQGDLPALRFTPAPGVRRPATSTTRSDDE